MKQWMWIQKTMERSVIAALFLFLFFILWKLSEKKTQLLHEKEQHRVDMELRNQILYSNK